MNRQVAEAVAKAHAQSECGDYYCGCWDSVTDHPHDSPERRWQHVEKFAAALEELGYKIVRVGA